MNIVQVGCNDCNDHVLEYIKTNFNKVNKLVLIDPVKNKLENCSELYKEFTNIDIVLVHSAITPKNKDTKINLFYSTDDVGRQHTSFNRQHLVAHLWPIHTIRKVRCKAKSINKIFEEFNLKTVDRLYVDTEGLDVQIINSINFDKWDIPYIRFESGHSDGPHSTGRKYNDLKKFF